MSETEPTDYEKYIQRVSHSLPQPDSQPPTQDELEAPFPTDLSHSEYLTPWVDLLNAQPATMLVDGFIPKAQTTWIYGKTGVGKSLVTMQIALDLANQTAVFGRLASQPVNILWLDYENGKSETRTRLEAFGQDLLNLAATKRINFGIMPPAASQHPQDLISLIQWLDIGLLIIDSSGIGIHGDSNNADTYSDFGEHLLNPLKNLDVTTIIMDNIGKDAKKRIIGSSRKMQEGGAVWELKENNPNLYQLTRQKERSTGLHKAIAIEKHTDPLRFVMTGEQGASPKVLTGEQLLMVQALDDMTGAPMFPNIALRDNLIDLGFNKRHATIYQAIQWWNKGNHATIE